MRKIHDVLRLHAVGLNIGRTAVGDYLRRARRAGLAWPLPEGLSDEALERLLFAPPPVLSPDRRPLPDWPLLHRELKRPGVTLSLLWEEYRAVQVAWPTLPIRRMEAAPRRSRLPCRGRQALLLGAPRPGQTEALGPDHGPHRRGLP